jgi:hypothetical protein
MSLHTLLKECYLPLYDEDKDVAEFHWLEEYPELRLFEDYLTTCSLDIWDIDENLCAHGYASATQYEITGILCGDEETLLNVLVEGTAISIKNPKTKTIMAIGVFARTKACLTKGASSLFYDEDRWSGACVLSHIELEHVFERYFSQGDPRAFKESILDNFIEGKSFVHFS